MKFNFTECLVVGMLTGIVIGGLGTMVLYENREPESELTCEVIETRIWAFQQCLKFQPGCQMNKGLESFAEYKQNKDWVVEHCPKNGDGFQS